LAVHGGEANQQASRYFQVPFDAELRSEWKLGELEGLCCRLVRGIHMSLAPSSTQGGSS
jgi:hypothetical protein